MVFLERVHRCTQTIQLHHYGQEAGTAYLPGRHKF